MNRRDQQFYADVRRRNLAKTLDLMCRRRHPHLKHREVKLLRLSSFSHHLQNSERQPQTVVIVSLALENVATRSVEQMRRQLFGRRFPCAACDGDDRSRPCFIDLARERLQRSDGIVDEQQLVSKSLQRSVCLDALPARDRCDCALLERLRNIAMSIGKRAVKPGARVITLRQREKEFARAGRSRVNRESDYFVVKQLGAQTTNLSAHQIRRRPYIHAASLPHLARISVAVIILRTASCGGQLGSVNRRVAPAGDAPASSKTSSEPLKSARPATD